MPWKVPPRRQTKSVTSVPFKLFERFSCAAQLSAVARLKTNMKHSYLPRNVHALTVTAIAAVGLLLTSGAALAQTTKTIKGHFHSTDGNHGIYVETIATDGDTETKTVVYTREPDKETSTDITNTVGKGTGTRTVAYSHTDFGSTAEFTASKTITKVKGGFVGTGTYTTAAGVTGTLKTLETFAADVSVVTATYTPSTGTGDTTDLRLEEDALGFVAVKDITIDPNGNTVSYINTRDGRF